MAAPLIVVDVALGMLALAFLIALVRVALGPTAADRAAGTDVCLFALVASFALLAVRLDAPALLDGVLVITLLGFLATVALARLLIRWGAER
ncbi:MAG: cation transporter [Actinomycetota bacterium]|jgi:multicomponent Na+:H+ antiporter subunit F|nr:MAG: cation transporter [Actinomycetota bacterium]